MDKVGPFEYVNAINLSKQDLIRDSDDPERAEAEYNPFIVNKALSMHEDTILYAGWLNMHPHIDSKIQNDYLLKGVRKKKRFGWIKPKDDERISLIMEAMQVNHRRACEISKILTDAHLEILKQQIFKGGK